MKRSLSIVLIATMATAVFAVPNATAVPERTPVTTVTLITGDQVALHIQPDGSPQVVFRAGKGREHVSYSQKVENGKVSVFPFDVQHLIANGTVDTGLFNVTDLLTTSKALPLIVEYASPGVAADRTADLRADGAEVQRVLPSANAVAIKVPASNAHGFWRGINPQTSGQARRLADGIVKISLDGTMKPLDAESVEQVRAPAAWRRGLTAKGVKVAVLDTGADAEHPDLVGRIVEARDFTGSPDGAADSVGHGTHVAGIIAGPAPQPGVAPDATLLIARVCEGFNCADSHVMAGMEWAVQSGAKVINMSLGGTPTDGTDTVSRLVNTLSERHGVLFIIGAGNNGAAQSVTTPGSASSALTVGSVTKGSQLSYFSSRGPRLADYAVKPEISAPGYLVEAARAKGTTLGFPLNDRYTQASGTSTAAAHVSGAAAILAGQHPDWSPARLKAALVSTAEPIANAGVFEQGAGVVNVDRATGRQVHAEPATLHLGAAPTGTITYRNDGDRSIRLNLQAPSGFTTDKREVLVPAKGSAQVNVTATAPSSQGALITARAGNDVLRTPVSARVPALKHRLVVNTIDRNGVLNGADGFAFEVFVADHDSRRHASGFIFDGNRLDNRYTQGRHTIFTWIPSRGPDPFGLPSFTLMAVDVNLNGDTEVTLDARTATKVQVTLNGTAASGPAGMALGLAGLSPVVLLSLGETYVGAATAPGMIYTAAQFVRGVEGSKTCGADGQTVCNLAVANENGPVATNPVIKDSDLARVRAEFAAPDGEGIADRVDFAQHLGSRGSVPAEPLRDDVTLPGTLTSYFHSIGPVGWTTAIFQTSPVFFTVPQNRENQRYTNGQEHRETWLSGVFGPAVTPARSQRNGDLVEIATAMLSDSSPGHTGRFGGTFGTGRIELHRNGHLVTGALSPDSATFQVSSENARYRLTATGSREAATSTAVEAVWEFQSQNTRAASALPLLAVRFANPQKMSDTKDIVPFVVDRTATTGRVIHVALEASFDDGSVWTKVPVVVAGDRGFAMIQRPAGIESVSLRATVRDSHGNTVSQKIVRAYRP